jgi:hypothetical protein
MLEVKVEELCKELVMYKKNQSILNRSQNLSVEIDSHN